MSALQLSRMLGVTYKSAWFLCHRIREAMTPKSIRPIGGPNSVVESDETVFGGKAKNRAEWDFKWNTRKTSDSERAGFIAKGIEGKRLTYRRISEATHA